MPHVNNIARSLLDEIAVNSEPDSDSSETTVRNPNIEKLNKEIARLQKKVEALEYEQSLIDSGVKLTRNTMTLWFALRDSFFPTQVFTQAGARALGYSQGPLSAGLKELLEKGLVERYPLTHSDQTRYCYRLVRKYCEGEA